MNLKTIRIDNQLLTVTSFGDQDRARVWAATFPKNPGMVVMMGNIDLDHAEFWVCGPHTAAALQRAGYEILLTADQVRRDWTTITV